MEDGLSDISDISDITRLYEWPDVIAVTGALGSGKSEWVLNLSMGLKKQGRSITIADADIINPYFCIRQVVEQLEQQGFSFLLPPDNGKWSDMALIQPRITAALAHESDTLMLDVGGDAEGVLALKQFEPEIRKRRYLLILVVNAYRPLTSTPEKIKIMALRMEELCGLKVGALVCNSHLMGDTRADDIVDGVKVVADGASALGLPLLYATVLPRFVDEVSEKLKANGCDTPVWSLKRYLELPWEGSELWAGPRVGQRKVPVQC